MLEAAVYGNFTPCSIRKFVKSVHGLQQAANGEKIAYNTAAKMPRGQAKQMRRRNQMKDHSHPQLAAILWSEEALRNDPLKNRQQMKNILQRM